MADAARKWEYELADIAKAAGQSLHTVRDHKESGRLDPANLRAVAAYIQGYRLIRQAEPEAMAACRGMVELDAWGNPVKAD